MNNIEEYLDTHREIVLGILISILMSMLWIEGTFPWLGSSHHANLGAQSSLFAKNYLRYGFLKTRFTPIREFGYKFSDNPGYYVHHPPLIFLLNSITFLIFGIKSWATRLVPIIATLGSLLLIYAMAHRWWGSLCAVFAAGIFAFTPMVTIYGSMVNFESPTTFFMLLGFYYYQKWFDKRSPHDLYLLGISVFLANSSEWAAFFLAPALIAHQRICDKTNFDRSLIRVLGIALLLFMAIMLYQVYFVADSFGDMIKTFLWRIGAPVDAFVVPWGGFFRLMFFRSLFFFTPHLIIASAMGLAVSFIPKYHHPHKTFFIVAMSVPAFFYTTVFKHGAWVHDFWIYHAAPFFALASAVFLSWLLNQFGKKKLVSAGIVLFFLLFTIRSLGTFFDFYENLGRDKNEWKLYFLALELDSALEKNKRVIRTYRFPTFFSYYMDRPFIFSDNLGDIKRIIAKDSSCRYIISHRNMQELNRDLGRSYSFEIYDEYLVFDIKPPGNPNRK